jgi:microcystin-dependent protein
MALTLASNAITFTDSTSLSSGVISTEQLASSVQQLLVPAGCVMSFAMSAAPIGWYPCDGTTVSRTGSGANLFAAIGTTYGVGNNSTTFNVPNLQGQFIRGLTTNLSTASRDPLSASRVIGSFQGDDFKSHTHNIANGNAPINISTSAGSATGKTFQYNDTGTTPILSAGGAETRPVNIVLLYAIKL